MRCLNHLAFRQTSQIATLATFGLESQPPSNWRTWQTNLRATNAQATRKRIRMLGGVRNLPIASTIRFEIPIVESAGIVHVAASTSSCREPRLNEAARRRTLRVR